jgi:hypothetical protein
MRTTALFAVAAALIATGFGVWVAFHGDILKAPARSGHSFTLCASSGCVG